MPASEVFFAPAAIWVWMNGLLEGEAAARALLCSSRLSTTALRASAELAISTVRSDLVLAGGFFQLDRARKFAEVGKVMNACCCVAVGEGLQFKSSRVETSRDSAIYCVASAARSLSLAPCVIHNTASRASSC